MLELKDIPSLEDVTQVVASYENFVREATRNENFEVRRRPKEVRHFSVAAWICKRHGISPSAFIVRLHRKHRKMEPNKIVPVHQLSTQYAEETASELRILEYQKTDEGKAKIAALLNSDIPLESDQRYLEALDRAQSGFIFESSAEDMIYAAERYFKKNGQSHEAIDVYLAKAKIKWEKYEI